MISRKILRDALTGSLLFLIVSCGCFPKAPDIRPKQIVQRLNICNQYVATFGDKLTFKFEKEIPLDECLIDGDFVLTDDELVEIRNFYNKASDCINKNPKCKKVVK